jgi:hypothetical protein
MSNDEALARMRDTTVPRGGGYSPVPPGWDENPTAWPKRIRLVVLAFVGLCVASYLTLYQLGVFAHVWDPFFQSGKVLNLLGQFPDAALGVGAYLAEIVLRGGGERAARDRPACTGRGVVHALSDLGPRVLPYLRVGRKRAAGRASTPPKGAAVGGLGVDRVVGPGRRVRRRFGSEEEIDARGYALSAHLRLRAH